MNKILFHAINSIRMAPETAEGSGLYAVKGSDLNVLIEAVTATCKQNQKNLTEVQNVLSDLEEYLDDIADAEYHPAGGLDPNKDMRLLIDVRAALEILK